MSSGFPSSAARLDRAMVEVDPRRCVRCEGVKVEGLGCAAARSTSSDRRMAENLKLFGWVPAADWTGFVRFSTPLHPSMRAECTRHIAGHVRETEGERERERAPSPKQSKETEREEHPVHACVRRCSAQSPRRPALRSPHVQLRFAEACDQVHLKGKELRGLSI